MSPSQKKIEIITIASNYHIEVNPSDVGIYDRVVIQELIKTVASSNQLNKEGQREFKVVVLTEVDKLTKDAQHALRRTMEKYMATCRVILVTNSTSKVIPAIRYGVHIVYSAIDQYYDRSRCLAVRVAAPSLDEVSTIVTAVAKKEGCVLPQQLAARIAERSRRNLRRAILMVEACKVAQYPFTADQEIQELDWEM